MAKATLFFDKRKNTSGKGTVKVMVTHERTQRLYTTKIQLEVSVWDKLQKNINANGLSSRVREEAYIELFNTLYEDCEEFGEVKPGFIRRSNEIIESIGSNFSFDKFKYNFDNYGKVASTIRINDIFGFYDAMIRNLNAEDRIGNAESYQNSKASIIRFCKKIEPNTRLEFGLPAKFLESQLLPFETVNISFLNKYERWMLTEGKRPKKASGKGSPASITTVGIYLRHLRAIFNEAIEEGVTKCYPFGKKRYVIPAGKGVKKAILKAEVLKIIGYNKFSNEFEQRSKDFWVFSYLSNGLNINDILRLKWSDIDLKRGTFTFVREKTKRTNKQNQKGIHVMLGDIQLQIIKRWSSKETEYVFPFIRPEMSVKRKRAIVKQFTDVNNGWMKKIGEKLQIDSLLGTYVARHSYSTILNQNNTPISLISKSLGHSSIATTEAYLGSFEDEQIQGYMEALV
jgi:integrase